MRCLLLFSFTPSRLVLFVICMSFGMLNHVVIAAEPLVACWLSTLEWLLNDTLLLATCYPSSFCLLLQCASFHVVSSVPHDQIAWCSWDSDIQIFFYEWEQLNGSIVHWWRVLLSCLLKKSEMWNERKRLCALYLHSLSLFFIILLPVAWRNEGNRRLMFSFSCSITIMIRF